MCRLGRVEGGPWNTEPTPFLNLVPRIPSSSVPSVPLIPLFFSQTDRYPFAARAGFRGATQWKENFSVMEYYPTDWLPRPFLPSHVHFSKV